MSAAALAVIRTHFSIRLDFTLPDSSTGHYAFSIGARKRGGYEVETEECRLWSPTAFH